jgi:putative heme-binding domain-containing protein
MLTRTLIHLCACFALLIHCSVFGQFAQPPPAPEWITHSEESGANAVFFRKTFEARLPLLKSILLGACDGRMTVHLNGQAIGEISGRTSAQGLDVTPHIRSGKNVLAIRAVREDGPPAIAVLLELNADVTSREWIISDASWVRSVAAQEHWAQLEFSARDWLPARSLGRTDATPETNPFDEKKAFDAYNSWKLALQANTATDPRTFQLPDGFKAELLRSAQPDEGSWVALAFDPEGRITVARETRGLLRLTLGSGGIDRVELIEDTLLECRGLLYAHGALYVNANNSKGFYRLRDTNGDGRFDETQLLLATSGGVGHGRNQIVLGPDGSLWLVHGNDVHLPKVSTVSPLKHFRDDTLIPWAFDNSMFDGGVLLPAGHILRTDADGTTFELFAGGLRNPIDIAFNNEGEMFTFDADMEWDVGAPWYRPNRVNHIVSGSDFGWRRGTAKWPDYLPDTLPTTLDIGLASPTGVAFGESKQFPPPYSEALFIADWAYGRILAVHLEPNGASYTGRSELFVSGRPLNVTGLRFGPDGAMYFVTGGRRTQSGLYRISYTGPELAPRTRSAQERDREAEAGAARRLRRELEAFHREPHRLPAGDIIETVWPHLGHSDVWIRHAARVALEQQESELWQARALAEEQIDVALGASLALARVGGAELQLRLVERLNHFLARELNKDQLLSIIRIFEIAIARMGGLDPTLAETARQQLEPRYPAADWRLNHRLCALLVHLQSPVVLERTLPLIESARRPEDLLQYLFYLRYVRGGWSLPERELFFRALDRADKMQGGRDYYTVLKRVREETLGSMTAEEKSAIDSMLHPRVSARVTPASGTPIPVFVREWKMEDFDHREPLRGRSFERGKIAYAAAQCAACHRLGGEGGFAGPDLAGAGSRFDRRALLESILEPSRVIDDKFIQILFTLADGSTVIGTVEREDEEKVVVRENMLSDEVIELRKSKITGREASTISPMPPGLLDSLDREQILDLLAFLESGGDPEHPSFK